MSFILQSTKKNAYVFIFQITGKEDQTINPEGNKLELHGDEERYNQTIAFFTIGEASSVSSVSTLPTYSDHSATDMVRGECIQPSSSISSSEPNPHLTDENIDILYHLAQDTSNMAYIKQTFGDVKFVCMGGSRGRVITLAKLAYDELKTEYDIDPAAPLTDLAKKAGRFVMFKVGPILTLNHGMGFGSLSIALHEVAKLLRYAGATDYCFVRMGTSGGLGADPGYVVITQEGFDATLQPGYEVTSCGIKKRYAALANDDLNCEFSEVATQLDIPHKIGNTMGCDDFYESQCRLDGAMCDYTAKDKFDFIRKAYNEHGVLNMEMEANMFLSFCNRLNIPGAVVCVTIVNRLNGDQITSSKQKLREIELYPLAMILQVIKNRLKKSTMEHDWYSAPEFGKVDPEIRSRSGYRQFQSSVIVPDMDYLAPCGMCLDCLSKFGSLEVILVSKDSTEYRVVNLVALLPQNLHVLANTLK